MQQREHEPAQTAYGAIQQRVDGNRSEQPERVQAMSDFYDQWWDESSPVFDEYVRLAIGSPVANPTTLNAHDWHDPKGGVPWNQGMIRRDAGGSGFWALQVAEFGTYRMTFSMRPPEANYEFGKGAIKIKVGDQEIEREIEAGAGQIVIETELFAGPTTLQTWVEEEGKDNRGAYFVTIEKID